MTYLPDQEKKEQSTKPREYRPSSTLKSPLDLIADDYERLKAMQQMFLAIPPLSISSITIPGS